MIEHMSAKEEKRYERSKYALPSRYSIEIERNVDGRLEVTLYWDNGQNYLVPLVAEGVSSSEEIPIAFESLCKYARERESAISKSRGLYENALKFAKKYGMAVIE